MSIEEKFNQAKGSVKEGFGKLTGDTKTQAEGAAEKVASKAKEVAEDAKEAVEGAVSGVKNIFKKRRRIILFRPNNIRKSPFSFEKGDFLLWSSTRATIPLRSTSTRHRIDNLSLFFTIEIDVSACISRCSIKVKTSLTSHFDGSSINCNVPV